MRLPRLALLLRLWLRLLLLDRRRQRHFIGQACTTSCHAHLQPLEVPAPQYAAAPLPAVTEWSVMSTRHEADRHHKTLSILPQGGHEPEAHEPEACGSVLQGPLT